MCSSSSARSSSLWSLVVQRHLVDASGAGRLSQREEASDDQAHEHGHDEVGEHRGQCGHDQHRCVAAGGAHQGTEAREADHLHGGGDEHAGQRRDRDHADPPGRHEHDDEQDDRMADGGQPGGGTGADVDGGPRDGRCCRDAAEERCRKVGNALSQELAVRVVPLSHAHPVGHGRGQQALERGQRRDRHGGQDQVVEGSEVDHGKRRRRQARGDGPDVSEVQAHGLVRHRGQDDDHEGPRHTGAQARQEDDAERDAERL